MGKLTLKGFVRKDHPMFSGGPEIFSPPESKQSRTSDKAQTTSEHPLAKMQRELVQGWRDSGLTVEEMEGSDGQDLTASVPQGKSPKSPILPSLPSQEIVEARLAAAIDQFKKDTAGKNWDDLANELEAKNKAL